MRSIGMYLLIQLYQGIVSTQNKFGMSETHYARHVFRCAFENSERKVSNRWRLKQNQRSEIKGSIFAALNL